MMESEKKVEYIELIYDLIFVYIIGRNNHLLHVMENGFIDPDSFLTYVLAALIVLQIWYYTTLFINRYGENDKRMHIAIFVNMYLLYFMARGIRVNWKEEFFAFNGAWLLILLNIALQYFIQLKKTEKAKPWECEQIKIRLRTILIQAGIIAVSFPVFSATGIPVSTLAVVFGIIAVIAGSRGKVLVPVDFPHLTERVMLYVVFTFGEMIIAITDYFEGGSLWEAYCALKKHEHDKRVKDIIKPFNRKIWNTLPFNANCSYTPSDNSIAISAAYAQDPNYRADMSDEELYAYIGPAIAYEIAHAFDAKGAQYDKDGNFINWWTDEDYAAFNEKNEKLAAYYNGMHPWEGQDFNGKAMVGEACADMTALKCMLRIAAVKPGFDYDKFFRCYADRCATKETLSWAMVLLEDEHPMNYLRVNANLQQFDEFLDFYGITEGDNMYLAPEDRVAIW